MSTPNVPNYQPTQQLGGSNLGLVTGAFYSMAEANLNVSGNMSEAFNASNQTSSLYNQASCKATIERGAKAALANWAQMGQSLLSGLTDLGSMIGQKFANSGYYEQIENLESEGNALKGIQTQVQDKLTTNNGAFEMQELDAAGNPIRDVNIESRIKEMQAGRFTTEITPNAAEKRLGMPDDEIKAERNKQAIVASSSNELNQIKGQIDDQVNNNISAQTKKMTDLQSKESMDRMKTDMVKQAIQGVGSAAQAYSAKVTAEAEADGKNDDYIQNAQTSTMQTEQQQFQQDISQAMSSLQALGQLSSAV
ncbi:MAG: hypothetical protein JSR39_02240 [Verrucomicrobia bacterium]|nr:hypothetical protein [Verrucomicrobiota bacterium]